MSTKKALGRGLNALISAHDEPVEEQLSGVVEINVNKIEPNRQQPRKYFDQEALEELAASIEEYGVIQPIIVKNEGSYYSIIAGERRWRAARVAKLEKVPAIIKDYNDLQVLQIALIENIQRADLNPIEEAMCFKRLIDEYFFKQEDIGEKIGRSRQYISNMLNLLQLDPRVQNFIIEGKLTAYHGRILLMAKNNNELQYEMADKIIEEGLSARAAEQIIKNKLENNKQVKKESVELPKIDYSRIEEDLKTIFGTKVQIRDGKDNRGKIEIDFYSQEDLDRLLGLIRLMEAGS